MSFTKGRLSISMKYQMTTCTLHIIIKPDEFFPSKKNLMASSLTDSHVSKGENCKAFAVYNFTSLHVSPGLCYLLINLNNVLNHTFLRRQSCTLCIILNVSLCFEVCFADRMTDYR